MKKALSITFLVVSIFFMICTILAFITEETPAVVGIVFIMISILCLLFVKLLKRTESSIPNNENKKRFDEKIEKKILAAYSLEKNEELLACFEGYSIGDATNVIVGLTNCKIIILKKGILKNTIENEIPLYEIFNIKMKKGLLLSKISFTASNPIYYDIDGMKKYYKAKSIEFNFKNIIKLYFDKFYSNFENYVDLEKEKYKNSLIKKYGNEFAQNIINSNIIQGMTQEMVVLSIGEPLDIKKTVFKEKTKESWFYDKIKTPRGAIKFKKQYNFENDVLIGWKDL